MIWIFKLTDEVWQQNFQERFEDREFALQIFEQYHAHIKQIVPQNLVAECTIVNKTLSYHHLNLS